MLLCHEFHKNKFIVPDEEKANSRAKRREDVDEMDPAPHAGPRRGKAAYSGGLVLEPKVGLYEDYVMMLDFNSLYPSVIQEHNICFTTVERPDEAKVPTFNSEAELLAETQGPDGTVEEGILPLVLRRLVESRRQVKAAIKSEKDPRRLQTLDIRQKALKITANSMYGTLGFQNSRFHAKPLAALVTLKGREALESTIAIVNQELQLDVVYGDTDSVFVNSKTQNYDQAMQVAQQIKRAVNKRYKRLEIEVDGVFGRLLLLKKKKYAGLKVLEGAGGQKTFEEEIKGLDIVRRDWCLLAKDMGATVLSHVLQANTKEEPVHWIHSFLADHARNMDDQKVSLDKYVITKSITKPPRDYPDAKNQPHVQVALRLENRGKRVCPGQEIEYVICDVESEGPKSSLADRARHPHEFELDKSLRVDVAWYKAHQVHPLISRLLDPIEGTDAARLAECLGMDSTRFARAAATAAASASDGDSYADMAIADVTALLDRTTRWKTFESRLEGVRCPTTDEVVSWRQLLMPDAWETRGVSVLFRSPSGAAIHPKLAQNLLVMQLRKLLREYSEGWVLLGDSEHLGMGVEKTRRMRRGKNALSEHHLHQELEFLEHLCAVAGKRNAAEDDPRGCRVAAQSMQRVCKWLLECNGYNFVDCGKIFACIAKICE